MSPSIKTPLFNSADWIYLFEADLFDPQNRNRLLWSDDLSETEWALTTATRAASARTDPAGGLDAWKLDATDTSAFDGLSQNITRSDVTDKGVVVLIAMQAESGVDIEARVGFRLLEVGGGAAVYTATSFKPVYGPGTAEIFTGGNKSVLVSGLSTTEWTVYEITWSLSLNLVFANDLQLGIYPGGATTNFGEIHVYRPHLEDELAPDGLGFRSRGQRLTEDVSGPDGAPGQTVTVRAGSVSFTTQPNDTYPGGGPKPAFNLAFPEGLLQPAALGKSAWIQQLVAGDGIIQTTVSGVAFNNTDGTRDQWAAYSWRERAARLFRGQPQQTFSQYEQVYEGSVGEKTLDDDSIRAPLRDPLHPLQSVLDREKFAGFGQCVRFGASADVIQYDQNPSVYLQGDVTVQAWVRFYDLSVGPLFKIAHYGAGGGVPANNSSWRAMLASGEMVWNQMSGAGVSETLTSGSSSVPVADFSDGEWHAATWVRDKINKTVKFYWDRVLIGSATYTTDPDGGEDGTPAIGGSGKVDIDDLRVWARQLSAAEISGLSGTPLDPEKNWNNGLRGYWQLDEGVGTLAWDSLTTRVDQVRMKETYISGDGVNGWTRTPHHADLNPSAGDWTWEVRFGVSQGGAAAFPVQIRKNQMYRMFFQKSNGKLFVGVYLTGVTNNWVDLGTAAGVYTDGQDGIVLLTGRWTASSRELALFINGTDKLTTIAGAGGDTINTNVNDLFLLANDNTPTNPMHGWIAEVRLWNEASSDADIAARANTVLVGDETNLKMWYTMDESRADEQPLKISVFSTVGTRYSAGKILDRQTAVVAKKNVTSVGAGTAGNNTTGILKFDARFVGTGEGFQDLEGKRKPYCLGKVFHAPLIEVDPFNLVYFANLPPMRSITDVFQGGHKLTVSELAGGNDDIWDQAFVDHPTKVYTRFGGAWTDETANAADATLHDGDITMLNTAPASGALQDGLYVAFSEPMTQMDLWVFSSLGRLSTDGALDIELSLQYWNGELWDDLRGVIDGTKALRLGGLKDWSQDSAFVGQLRSVYTKTSATKDFFNGVSNIVWDFPPTWIKESLDNIATATSLAAPGDTTARWWVRIAATANPIGYDKAPRSSAIWVSQWDAVVDSNRGLVRFASPPKYKPTCHVEGDTSEGSWAQVLPDAVKTVINRFYAKHNYVFNSPFGDGAPDYTIGRYAGLGNITGVQFLGPLIAGGRSALDAGRDAKLSLLTFTPSLSPSADFNITESPEQLLNLESVPMPDPPLSVSLNYRPYSTEMSEGDFSPIVPISIRKDVGAQWRVLDGDQLLNQNDERYLEAEPLDIFTYLSVDGEVDGVDSELDKWVEILGAARQGWRLLVPTGMVETELGLVIGLKTTRYGIWFGVELDPPVDGPIFAVLEYEESMSTENTKLIVWGTSDAES